MQPGIFPRYISKVKKMNKAQNTKKTTAIKAPANTVLFAQVTATQKNVEKAWTAYLAKEAAYKDAVKQHAEKILLKSLLAAAKIEHLTFKIKKIEHKLAKAKWKSASKAGKKADQDLSGKLIKSKATRADHKAPKDTASKGKSSQEAKPAKKIAQKGKKAVETAS